VGDSPTEAQVEVAHEALIRNWDRLRDWLSDERVTLRQRIHLRALAEQWHKRNQDRSILLRGSFLEEVTTYKDLSELELQFIEHSKNAEKRKSITQIGMTAIVCSIVSGLVFFVFAEKNRIEAAQIKARTDAANAEKFVIRSTLDELNSGKLDERSALNKIYAALEIPRTDSPSPLPTPPTMSSPAGYPIRDVLQSTPPPLNPLGKMAKVTGSPDYLRNIRTEPGTKNEVICTIKGGITVEIKGERKGPGGYLWYEIKAPDGCSKDGWIAAHLVDVIGVP
jgi:hypothetical protein